MLISKMPELTKTSTAIPTKMVWLIIVLSCYCCHCYFLHPLLVCVATESCILLQSTDSLSPQDGELHVQQTSEAMLSQDTDQWSIQLTCGLFNASGSPPFNVEWIVSGYHPNHLLCFVCRKKQLKIELIVFYFLAYLHLSAFWCS